MIPHTSGLTTPLGPSFESNKKASCNKVSDKMARPHLFEQNSFQMSMLRPIVTQERTACLSAHNYLMKLIWTYFSFRRDRRRFLTNLTLVASGYYLPPWALPYSHWSRCILIVSMRFLLTPLPLILQIRCPAVASNYFLFLAGCVQNDSCHKWSNDIHHETVDD